MRFSPFFIAIALFIAAGAYAEGQDDGLVPHAPQQQSPDNQGTDSASNEALQRALNEVLSSHSNSVPDRVGEQNEEHPRLEESPSNSNLFPPANNP